MAVSCASSKLVDISEPPFAHLKAWLDATFVESVAAMLVAPTVYRARLHIRSLSLALWPPAVCLTEEEGEVLKLGPDFVCYTALGLKHCALMLCQCLVPWVHLHGFL